MSTIYTCQSDDITEFLKGVFARKFTKTRRNNHHARLSRPAVLRATLEGGESTFVTFLEGATVTLWATNPRCIATIFVERAAQINLKDDGRIVWQTEQDLRNRSNLLTGGRRSAPSMSTAAE